MMGRRHEFGKETRRAAIQRAGGMCEAVGPLYGLAEDQRCGANLGYGFELDHYPLPAGDADSDTLANCVVCCKVCHRHKTSHYDVPMQAKGKRVQDRARGTKVPTRNPLHSRNTFKPWISNTRDVFGDLEEDKI